MKTKNITLIIILSTLIASSESCYSMGYMQRARNWTTNFMVKCWNVGVLATIYAGFGIYDFNKITGLNEEKLSQYNSMQLQNAKNRIDIFITHGTQSDKLVDFFNKVEAQYQQAKIDKDTTPIEEQNEE